MMTWLAAGVTFTLLLTLVGGRLFLVVQVLADCAFVLGIFACRWSVGQERAVAARSRRRDDTRELRRSLDDLGRSWSVAPDAVPVMTVPLAPPTMTVPLDAPAQPRRAAPIPAPVSPEVRRPVPARPVPQPRPRPRAEPVVLAEIDLDWEPAVPEPQSCVRLVDVTAGPRRAVRLFDEAPADGVDVGDDAELDALVQRRLAASGW